jgi:predicted phage-related endonuclease
VISAFEKAYPGAKVKGYLAEAGNGKMHYEIESVKGKTTIDALLHPDGTFFEVEEGMAAKNLPANVSGEVTSKYPKAKFAKVEMVTRETEITYDMSLTEGKSKIRLTLDPNEKI